MRLWLRGKIQKVLFGEKPMKQPTPTFHDNFPGLAEWAGECGWIEIGQDDEIKIFGTDLRRRRYDMGKP